MAIIIDLIFVDTFSTIIPLPLFAFDITSLILEVKNLIKANLFLSLRQFETFK